MKISFHHNKLLLLHSSLRNRTITLLHSTITLLHSTITPPSNFHVTTQLIISNLKAFHKKLTTSFVIFLSCKVKNKVMELYVGLMLRSVSIQKLTAVLQLLTWYTFIQEPFLLNFSMLMFLVAYLFPVLIRDSLFVLQKKNFRDTHSVSLTLNKNHVTAHLNPLHSLSL